MKHIKLFLINAFYMFVMGSSYPLIPLYLEELKVGVIEKGYILTGAALLSALSSLFWGYLSDRTGKRRIFVLAGGLGQTLTYLLLSFPQSMETVIPLYLISGFLGSATFTLVMASAGSSEGEVSEAMGNFWAGGSLGWAIGTAASGYIFEKYGLAFVFLISTAFLASYTLLAYSSSRDLVKREEEKKRESSLPLMMALLLLLVFIFVCVDVLKNLYIPPHYAYELGIGPAVAMLTLSFTSWLEIPSIFFFSRLARKVSRWVIFASSFIFAAAYLALNCFASDVFHAFTLMGFYSLVWGSFSVSSSTLVSELTETYGTAYGAYNMVYSIANIAAPLLASSIIDSFGYNTLLQVFAVLSLASCFTAILSARKQLSR
ncbi:MAG: MFS transporter [Thermofilaceae archaeon]|nr:MFS transporter [Thermofilaceae archaeon]MCX8180997.1 MFS transporter [Thermofilaceae archaeon]MDW8004102.1 MFS transporter [Thermofilaceae archaeon]